MTAARAEIAKFPVVPWVERPTIELDADQVWRDRLANVPDEAIDDARRLLNSIREFIPLKARPLADALRLRTANRFHAETLAASRRAGVDWRTLFLANLSYEFVLASLGCSTVALPSPSGPVLARNMDFFPEDLLAQASYLLRTSRHNQLEFVNAGWPGAIGVVSGLSGRGFAVVLNAVLSPERRRYFSYPVLLHIRRVLENACNFADAVDRLAKQRLITGALFTVAGTNNDERVVIERSPTRHALRWGEPGKALIATNDYRQLFQTEAHNDMELYRTTCSRYDALCRFFADHDASREIEDDKLLYVLSDPSVMQEITAQHVILRPTSRESRLFVPRHLLAAVSGGPRSPSGS